MSEQPITRRGEGEQLHARRRRNFWLMIAGLMLVGFAGGFTKAMLDDRAGGLEALPPWIGVVAIAFVLLLAIGGSWRFFTSVDEVELADNLWGSLIGFYAYVLLLPAWWALNKLQLVPAPDQWIIYGVSLAIGGLAYLYRKLALR